MRAGVIVYHGIIERLTTLWTLTYCFWHMGGKVNRLNDTSIQKPLYEYEYEYNYKYKYKHNYKYTDDTTTAHMHKTLTYCFRHMGGRVNRLNDISTQKPQCEYTYKYKQQKQIEPVWLCSSSN